ncbi:GDP-mannose 4,6-dehydratase [Chloroflexota bacterium]
MSQSNRVTNWNRQRILVTGAGGFIGSHLAEHLIELGAKVKAFVRYNSRSNWGLLDLLPREKLDEIEIIMGDLRDCEAVRNTVKGTNIVFHLGALVAIPYSYIHPRETIETNIIGTLNVLNSARDNNVEKTVYTSTSEVYGTAQYVPIDENHPLQGQSPYSASKIGAEKIAESFSRSFGVPLAIIRPFNTFGPRQSTRAVIPTIVTQVLTKEQIYLGSLHPRRDYTYVDDVVDAFIKMAESPISVGEIINIGSNFEISIGDIANKVITAIGRNNIVTTDPMRIRPAESEVERLWCDNTKAKNLLAWEPKIAFDEGLIRTIKWISDNIALYKPELYNR